MGAESALVDGVDTEEGDRAARWETDVAAATGEVGCPVRCQLCWGDASDGTEMPFLILGESPCARGARGASAYGKDGLRYGNGERKGSYRGKYTTEDKAKTMDVSIVVGVVLDGGWWGRVGGVVRRLGVGMRVRG